MEGSNVLFYQLRQTLMKPVWVLLGAVLLGGSIFYALFTYGAAFDAMEPEVIEVSPEWYDETCEECHKAYEDTKRQRELRIKAVELEEEIGILQFKLDEVEKELGTY